MFRFVSLGAAVLVALLSSPVARAQSNAEADAAISQGIQLRRQGKDEQALESFRKADRIAPSPRSKAQIGLAEQAIGRWAEAERDLGEALSHASDPWITRQMPVLTEAMNVIHRHLGSLTVRGEPEGAIVELNGEPIGTIPMPERHLTAGEVAVTVRAPGFVGLTRKVTVTPGELAAEEFKLKRLDSDSAAAGPGSARRAPVDAPSPSPPPAGQPDGTVISPASDQPPPVAPAGGLRMAAWGTAIGAAVALAAGTTFTLLGQSKSNSFNDDATCDLVAGKVVGDAHCHDLYDSWHTDRAIGYVGLAVGGVLAVSSVVLFVKTRGQAVPASSTQALAGCGPSAATSVACVFRF